MPLGAPTTFSSVQIIAPKLHARQASVASFASSLYLPVDPDSKPIFDENDAYPSSDELFGLDHEEGDNYTISSRRYLSSYSRYSSSITSPRSTISLERPPSLTPPHPSRYSNLSPLAPVASTTISAATTLPSPPSTARSSNDTRPSSQMSQSPVPNSDENVPIEKFDQLALEHLEQDRALLQTLRKLEDQNIRIAQLTHALSRLRVLSNSACLLPPEPNAPRSSPPMQFPRLGTIPPRPLVVRPSANSASSSAFCSAFSMRGESSGLTGPSFNEAINQRRRAKQQLHEFALRRPTRNKGRPSGRFAAAPPVPTRQTGWEGARGSSSLVPRETTPRAPGIIDHPNITTRRMKRAEPVPPPKTSRSSSSTTPPRLASLFLSPTAAMSRSPSSTQPQRQSATHESPTSPVLSRHTKPLPPRPVSPTMPMKLAKKMSFNYALPPVPPPNKTTAHITLLGNTANAPLLPAEEVQNRLAATFAHFTKPRARSPSSLTPSPPRRALDMSPPDARPDYLDQLLHKKWVEQLDEHAHQARGSWKSPLRSIRQRFAGGFGLSRARRTSIGESSEAHTQPGASIDGNTGYVPGLDTLDEGAGDDTKLPPVPEHKLKPLKKKGGIKDEGADAHSPATPSSGTTGSSSKPLRSTWRFSRIGHSHT